MGVVGEITLTIQCNFELCVYYQYVIIHNHIGIDSNYGIHGTYSIVRYHSKCFTNHATVLYRTVEAFLIAVLTSVITTFAIGQSTIKPFS